MIRTVIVGYGLAGQSFHAPLIRRQGRMEIRGFVARDAGRRAEAVAGWGGVGYSSLEGALADSEVDLIVLATPHDVHASQVIQTLEAGKDCVVDKVMALSEAEADAMIEARDRSGRMLSVFHNRRWDWDFSTVRGVLASGRLGRPFLVESSVCRYAPPRTWRGRAAEAGTILHDWGAHLVDQALHLGLGRFERLRATLTPAPWPGVDIGGHGRIVLEGAGTLVQLETSRICRLDRPRWWVLGPNGGLVKDGLDPQEAALREGNLDAASEADDRRARVRDESGESVVETIRSSWDAYYANIAAHLIDGEPLAVTAEHGREVVRVLDAAVRSAAEDRAVEGPWGWPD
ncbi:Gfo/Idh/MocA family oxidoreductase [Isosphaeraceae bacterium EP7]